jgi:hypothetical protein
MKPSKHTVKAAKPKIVDLAAMARGSESIAYRKPVPIKNEPPQITISEHGSVEALVGAVLDGHDVEPRKGAIDGVNRPPDWKGKAARETGGRSEVSLPAAKVTAKPLPPIPSPISSPIPDHNGDKMVTTHPLLSKPKENPLPGMPVLGDLRGVGEDVAPKVVQTYRQVPFTPEIEPPFDTNPVEVSSPFVTGNDRIDRRTAFTQFCRLGEGRTYIQVANIMALPESKIREWGKEDGWENAYRSSVTADIAQIAKEENIHEYLDVKREIIAQLKAKIQEAKAGKDVFKNPKEMLDTMLRLEELTGAKGLDGNARPGQIFVIIERSEWEAREKLNEKTRKEELEKG